MKKSNAGRPALPEAKRRKFSVYCRFTEPEVKRLNSMRGDVPLATFVRLRALGGGK